MSRALEPLVSVGMTTFNQPEKLRKALDCVVNQTYRNLEILVSEDCTPCETTKEILADFENKDLRIRVIHQPTNLGPPDNINYVLSQAKGEYFMWADDDDLRDTRWVESLLHKLMGSQSAIAALGNVVAIDEDDKPVQYCESLEFRGQRTRRLASYFLADEAGGKACVVCGIFRTDFLQSIKPWGQYDKGYFGTDFLFVMDCLQHGEVLVDPSVTVYKRRPAGTKTQAGSSTIERLWRRLQYYVNCVRLPVNRTDGLVLFLLLPLKAGTSLLTLIRSRFVGPAKT